MGVRIALIVFAAWTAALAGCNTLRGIGKDVEAVGNAIQRSAR